MTSVSGEFGLSKQKLSVGNNSVQDDEIAAIESSALAICKGTFGDQWVVADYDALAAADVLWYPPALKSSTNGGPLTVTASLPGYVKKGSTMWESNNQGKGARFYYITRIISNPVGGTFMSPDNMTGTDVNPTNTPVASLIACTSCHPRDLSCIPTCGPVPTFLSSIRLEAHYGAKRVFCSGPNAEYTAAPTIAPTAPSAVPTAVPTTAPSAAPTAVPTIAPTRTLGGIVTIPNGVLTLSESGEDIVEVLSVVPTMVDAIMTSIGATTVTASCASDDVTVLAPASITIAKGSAANANTATIKVSFFTVTFCTNPANNLTCSPS